MTAKGPVGSIDVGNFFIPDYFCALTDCLDKIDQSPLSGNDIKRKTIDQPDDELRRSAFLLMFRYGSIAGTSTQKIPVIKGWQGFYNDMIFYWFYWKNF